MFSYRTGFEFQRVTDEDAYGGVFDCRVGGVVSFVCEGIEDFGVLSWFFGVLGVWEFFFKE